MTDTLLTWATSTAADGRRTGPEKAIAQRIVDVAERWRKRIASLEELEREHALTIAGAQDAIDCAAHERAGLEMMLEDLCGPLEMPAKEPSAGKRKGGLARAESLSPERRTEIAKAAAAARWGEPEPAKEVATADALGWQDGAGGERDPNAGLPDATDAEARDTLDIPPFLKRQAGAAA